MTSPSTAFASRIIGTGAAYPARRLTNDELSRNVETSDEWIRERTGISERRIAVPGNPEDQNSALGTQAALQALEMAGMRPEDIDLILYATCTPDMLIPSTACMMQMRLGATRAWALDLNAACSGFVYGLATADQFLRGGNFKTALVVGGDLLTAFTDWNDRGSCILFGDAAGAAVLERVTSDFPSRILSCHLGSEGKLWDLFFIPAGGSNLELTPERHKQRLNKMQMRGREMYKVAVNTLTDYAIRALEANRLTARDIDWMVPHQANLRIIEAVAKRLEVPMEKVIVNIQRFGNTSSATVPTALDEAVRDGRIRPGQLVLLDVFGAGLTYGSVLMRW